MTARKAVPRKGSRATPSKPGGGGAGSKNVATQKVRASSGRATVPRTHTPKAGGALLADLTREGMGVAESLVLRQAARTADRLEIIDALLAGSAEAWCAVSIPRTDAGRGRVYVEVQASGLVREERALAKLLRELLADLARRSAGEAPPGADDDDLDID